MSGDSSHDVTAQEACDIVGIGVSVWDSVFLVDVFPNRGTVVRANRRVEGIGGGVSVAIATAARLGSTAAMVDSLGDDAAAHRIVTDLAANGVQTRGISQITGHSSSVASIWSDLKSNERTIVYSPGSASDSLRWSTAIEALVLGAKVVHLNGRHARVCEVAIRLAREVGAKVSFDGGAHRYREEIIPMLTSSDIVIVAKEFAMSHYRNRDGAEDCPRLQRLTEFLMADLECEIAGVTDGINGSFLIQRDGDSLYQPAVETDRAVDTTGCGDTYHGGFLHAYVLGYQIDAAAELAARIASSNSQSMGALAFEPTKFTSP
ncbi:MAG: carbohydrate kinase family protein [Planctomycetales bacterium]|nr:carbohydrate kinase family protein [Planctomycetales bacterium]